MPLNLRVPTGPTPDDVLTTTINDGESLFILGANGVGKSSLISRLFSSNAENARRISAHRQTWFENNTLSMTGRDRQALERNTRSWDTSASARFVEHGAAERTQLAIYDLINAQNIIARNVLGQHRDNNHQEAQNLALQATPIENINELLKLSNLPLELTIKEDDSLVARKNGGPEFSVAQMSDGERNALLIAANALTVPQGTFVFIDEPERHLHRSIISPLLSQLFSKRSDCIFIISTHDPLLPLDNPLAKTLLVRNCIYNGAAIQYWEADLLEPRQDIDEELKKEILGSRRKLLFVEGTENSLDKPLYSLVFPAVSVIAKSSCRDVEDAVSGIRDADNLHWVKAFGIVDNDHRPIDEIAALQQEGVYALNVYSVEAVYYHEEIQRRLAERQAAITGHDVATMLNNAKTDALQQIAAHAPRLSGRIAEKSVRQKIFQHLPKKGTVIPGAPPININVDVAADAVSELTSLQQTIAAQDLSALIARYPVRETPALDRIATNLGFQDRKQYHDAVRKLLIDDADTLTFVRNLFGALYTDILV